MVKDHLGNEYKSYTELGKKYGLNKSAITKRLRKGYTLEETLTIPSGKATKRYQVCDHLGNIYSSMAEMLKHYNISKSVYEIRKKKKWSLEKILTTPIKYTTKAEITYDHLGNKFDSFLKMCQFYNKNCSTVKNRLNKGWSLEDALTKNRTSARSIEIYDHLGNKFESMIAMCKHYNMNYQVIDRRLRNGWDIEKALTTPAVKAHKKSYDHLGNEFASITDMCDHYKTVTPTAFNERIAKGWTVEQALLTPSSVPDKPCDHLGNEYETVDDLCAAYGISVNTYYSRMKSKWSLEDRLTTPSGEHRPAYDHLGNKFKSKVKMCEHYNINYGTFKDRMKNNWTLEKALTTPSNETIQYDHLGNIFESKTKLCEHYGIKTQRFNYFKDKGYTIEECLNIIPIINANTKNIKINNTFIIKECITKIHHEVLIPNLYFLCSHDNIDLILSREAILNYCKKHMLQAA